jgi:hypothetical protein
MGFADKIKKLEAVEQKESVAEVVLPPATRMTPYGKDVRTEDLVSEEQAMAVRVARKKASQKSACPFCSERVTEVSVVTLGCGCQYHLTCWTDMRAGVGTACLACGREHGPAVLDYGEAPMLRNRVMKTLETEAEKVRINRHGGMLRWCSCVSDELTCVQLEAPAPMPYPAA